ncbi:uncharacterized protein LOC135375693 [Ornithodoros turicata]|uniref:uncharacterized protein LOC135375693 n=1 Tax=Ornithodoros turicata TaxID=34597 RepID=UPI00313A44BD
MGVTGAVAAQKFQTMKAAAEKKKFLDSKRSGCGAAEVRHSKWAFYTTLDSFLGDRDSSFATLSNIPAADISSPIEENCSGVEGLIQSMVHSSYFEGGDDTSTSHSPLTVPSEESTSTRIFEQSSQHSSHVATPTAAPKK